MTTHDLRLIRRSIALALDRAVDGLRVWMTDLMMALGAALDRADRQERYAARVRAEEERRRVWMR